jgi:hypothetical protein
MLAVVGRPFNTPKTVLFLFILNLSRLNLLLKSIMLIAQMLRSIIPPLGTRLVQHTDCSLANQIRGLGKYSVRGNRGILIEREKGNRDKRRNYHI